MVRSLVARWYLRTHTGALKSRGNGNCHSLFRRLSSSAANHLHPTASEARTQSTEDHLNFDRHHLWHPYTSLSSEQPPTPVLPVERADGCCLYLETGETLVDGMSSWWSTVHGYNHPVLVKAMHRQLNLTSHVMFGGLTHRPAVELASLLVQVTPASLTKVFFADSGSVAVEVALKMALQYHRGRGFTKKTKFISLKSGYHGDTFGAMSVCDTGMHSAFADNLMQNIFVPRPPCDPKVRLSETTKCHGCSCQEGYGDALEAACVEMESTLEKHCDSVAAMILEPLVQGAGGMRFYETSYLKRVRDACTKHNVLLICDEIATGFGRAGGAFFASTEAGIEPDIMCVGKAITGGTMTLGVTLATEEVADGVSALPKGINVEGGALPLMHGPTFMANPLACAVSVASVSMLLEDKKSYVPMWKARTSAIESQLLSKLQPAVDLEGVADVRVRGAIGVIEMKEPMDSTSVTYRCRELGAWLRPFGRLLYTMPPFVIQPDELEQVTSAMLTLADEAS
jgi:adenosylmethionine-8-amino-7-oxononanoate aminotransferase